MMSATYPKPSTSVLLFLMLQALQLPVTSALGAPPACAAASSESCDAAAGLQFDVEHDDPSSATNLLASRTKMVSATLSMKPSPDGVPAESAQIPNPVPAAELLQDGSLLQSTAGQDPTGIFAPLVAFFQQVIAFWLALFGLAPPSAACPYWEDSSNNFSVGSATVDFTLTSAGALGSAGFGSADGDPKFDVAVSRTGGSSSGELTWLLVYQVWLVDTSQQAVNESTFSTIQGQQLVRFVFSTGDSGTNANFRVKITFGGNSCVEVNTSFSQARGCIGGMPKVPVKIAMRPQAFMPLCPKKLVYSPPR